MWMLSFIPDALIALIVHIILAVGVIGFFVGSFASKFPFISAYGNIVKIVAGILLVAGLYLEGGIGVEQEWRNKVAEAEAKVKIAEEKAKQENVRIQTVYKDKVKIVKEQQIVIQERIKEVEKKIDAECKVAPEAIDLLNQAARVK
jgi:hypothetical protein